MKRPSGMKTGFHELFLRHELFIGTRFQLHQAVNSSIDEKYLKTSIAEMTHNAGRVMTLLYVNRASPPRHKVNT